MLIPSCRHTREDLSLWADLEEADKANGERLLRSGKVEQAETIAFDYQSDGEPAYVSMSWGKDSVVTAHIVFSCRPDLPVVYNREMGLSNPHCHDVAREFVKQFPKTNYFETPIFHKSVKRLSTGDRPTKSEETKSFLAGCDRTQAQFGRRIMGIRRDESSSRKISAIVHGVATKNVCRPILYWTAEDVFAYLAMHNLPIHPNYAMLGGGRYNRKWLRVDCLAGPQGRGMGRAEWENEYYPEEMRKISAGVL